MVFDHSDTTLRLGEVMNIHHDRLHDGSDEEKKRRAEVQYARAAECSQCGFVRPPKQAECPNCGFKPERQSDIVEGEGQLAEVTGRQKEVSSDEKRRWYTQLIRYARDRGKKDGWAYYKYKEKFGKDPFGPKVAAYKVDEDVLGFIKSRAIAYAKAQEAKSNAA